MRPPAGNTGTGYGGLPKPPQVTHATYNGSLDALQQLSYLFAELMPSMALRNAFNVDRRRWVGRRIP